MSQSETKGYYRQPTIRGDDVIFVCEADLWHVPRTGGTARRLTANQVDAFWPHLSADGKWIAYSAVEEGATEVYLMPASGGHAQRLTFHGSVSHTVGFSADGKCVLYASMAEQPFSRQTQIWSVPLAGGSPVRLPIGPARRLSYDRSGAVVISRREQEIARWKRYRGGTRGDLWVDSQGNGEFTEILTDFAGNLGSPCFVQGKIYFIADHEGHGNVYVCNPDGSGLKRLTEHTDFYARALATDGQRLVYQCGAELYTLDPQAAKPQLIDVLYNSSKPQLTRRFVHANRYLTEFDLHPDGHSLLTTSRGKPFVMGNWEREVMQLGEREGVRYRHCTFTSTGQDVVAIADTGGEEALEVLALPADDGTLKATERFADLDLGRVIAMAVSPKNKLIAVSNNRCEVLLVNLETRSVTKLDQMRHDTATSLSFSADGRYLAFAGTKVLPNAQIFVADTQTGTCQAVTRNVGNDSSPAFDPDGKYLYFLSARVLNPVYDSIRFDLGFPKGIRPYLIALRKDVESPFHPRPRPVGASDKKDKDKEAGAEPTKTELPKTESPKTEPAKPDAAETAPTADAAPKPAAAADKAAVTIDFAGIEDRILEFPVPEGRYRRLWAAHKRIYYSELPIEGSLGASFYSDKPTTRLMTYDFETLKPEVFADAIEGLTLTHDAKTMALKSKDRIRVLKSGAKADFKDMKPGRQSGVVDLDRIRVQVTPAAEWRQMFREMWRLQRDHFWTTDLSQVDWREVYDRYLPILARVATRSEFSDLAWEVQGELGTSHAYEMGGDLRQPPPYSVGKLGAELAWAGDGYEILRILRGDSWDRTQDSPLAALGLEIAAGDKIVAIDDQALSAHNAVGESLVHKAQTEVAITVKRPDGTARRLCIKPLGNDQPLRYRDFVEHNRAVVHTRSDGKLGYVHVPDMGPRGYAEFFRYFVQESYLDGLIVDVRFNGGGHVSQFLLEKLMRRRTSYMVSHHMAPIPEPHYAVAGPIVAITNEHAGSDGDIFSHSFKLLGLGKLIGKRTWGGVVGIDGRNHLVDGTVVTQPEYSTWFEDVGFAVENYGTDPDIEVDISPQQHAQKLDTQLDRAIAEALAALAANPPAKPDFSARPNLGPAGR